MKRLGGSNDQHENLHNERLGMLTEGRRLSELPESKGGFRELFEGDLSVDNDERRYMTAVLLKNTQDWLNSLSESTRSVQVGGFQDYLFPLIRATFTNAPYHDLVSIQPMTRKIGQIFFMNYIVGQSKGGRYTKGERLYDVFEGYKGGSTYSDETVIEEDQGETAGVASATISGQLAYLPLRRNSISITIDDATVLVVQDNGNGGFTKVSGVPNISSGSINYETGAWTITFSANLGTSKAISASYEYESEDSSNLPQVDIQITSSAVVAKRRALRVRYSQDSAFDFQQEFGLDINPAMVAGVADLIKTEVAREIISDIWRVAGAPVSTFAVTGFNPATAGYPRVQHFQDFIYELNQTSQAIYDATQRLHGNWLVCDSNAATMIESLPDSMFKSAGVDNTTQGVQFMGTINNQYKVFKDNLLGQEPGASSNAGGNILMGYKGKDFWDAGYVYAPYQALFTTPDVTLDDFVTRKGLATRYAKKIVNNRMYKRIALT